MEGEADFEELESVPFEYSLRRLPDGRHVLLVVANQSAFYFFKEHELTVDELARFRAEGRAFLASLARRVRYEPA